MATKKQIETGTRNLRRYRDEHPNFRPNLRHGIHSFLNGGNAPPAIQAELDAMEAGLIKDLGGDLTMAQRVLIATARRALGVVMLGWAWIEQHGIVDRDGTPCGIIGMLASYMNSLRLSLLALGLERKPKSTKDLDAIIEEHSSRRRG